MTYTDYKSPASKNKSINQIPLSSDIVTIPVVFHILQPSNSYPISQLDLLNLLDKVNEDFRMLNADVASERWPQASDAKIEFCLASIDPNGEATQGFTVKTSGKPCWVINSSNIDPDIRSTSNGGQDPWNQLDYINIWIANLSCSNILGNATFPSPDLTEQGIVIDESVLLNFLSNSSPYNKGRVLTHEFGHFFNLCHVWSCGSDNNTNCAFDDGISDTPQTSGPHSQCEEYSPTCGASEEMWENFMDYTNDDCKTLFTENQVQRMRETLMPIYPPSPPSENSALNRESLLYSNGCEMEPQCLLKYKIVFDFSQEFSIPINIGSPPVQNQFNPFLYSVKYSDDNQIITSGSINNYPQNSRQITIEFCASNCFYIDITSQYDYIFGLIYIYSPYDELIGSGNITDYYAEYCEATNAFFCPNGPKCNDLEFSSQSGFYLTTDPINTDGLFYTNDNNYLSISNRISLAYQLPSPINGNIISSISFDLRSHKLPSYIKIGFSEDLNISSNELYTIGGSSALNGFGFNDLGHWKQNCFSVLGNTAYHNKTLNYIVFVVDDPSQFNTGWAEFQNIKICRMENAPPRELGNDPYNTPVLNDEENNYLIYNLLGQLIGKAKNLSDICSSNYQFTIIAYSRKLNSSKLISPCKF